jgi:2-polyprenyl-3-methyl-5-hydroxy-6-metoxy-1,4-benzoquinol methylase
MNTTTNDVVKRTYQELFEIWRHCLTGDRFTDPQKGVADELGTFSGLPLEKVRWIWEHSAEIMTEEWRKTGQSTPDDLYRFYQAQTYWLFGTLRYHAKQVEPNAVNIAHALQQLPTGHHLDFGCGAGTANLFFNSLVWQSSLADVSESAIDFVRYRFKHRGIHGRFYNLETNELPPNTYNLITALNVMVHVANIPATLRRLHQSLKPGGYLVFNIDSRKPTAMSKWHLYDAHYPVIRHVRQAGFRRLSKTSIFYRYSKIDRSSLNAFIMRFFDRIRHNRVETAVGEQIQRLMVLTKKVLSRIARSIHGDP